MKPKALMILSNAHTINHLHRIKSFNLILIFFSFSVGLLHSGCGNSRSKQPVTPPATRPTAIRYTGTSWELLRHGTPYFIRGACTQGRLDRLAACGGNSLRIWSDNDAGPTLDHARQRGLTVMFGLWVEREIEGFDYQDKAAVDRQFERIRKTVLAYRHHPALLMWAVGNECALNATDLTVYDEINRIIRMIHELDPDHPVTTVISLDSRRAVWLARERCPDLDVLSVNVYGDIDNLRDFIEGGGWTGPYLISEFGTRGYWEIPKTPWSTPIEPNSQEKYEFVKARYRQYIGARPPNCLGAYLFLWGTKQEETHTWYSLFDEQGRETPLVGLMQHLWTNAPPANQAPVIKQLLVDHYDTTGLSFSPGRTLHRARIVATDPDGDSLTYKWEIRPAARQRADYDNTPLPVLTGLIHSATGHSVTFRVPDRPGSYRLFVYIYDNHNHVADANLAFRTKSSF